MDMNLEEVLKNLEVVRSQQGQDAYEKARHSLALMLVLQPRGEDFLKQAFPDLDLGPIREQAQGQSAFQSTSQDQLMAFIRAYVPSLRTENQFALYMAAFQALNLAFEGYFAGRPEEGDRARQAITTSLDLATKLHDVEEQLREMPEEQRGPEAQGFVNTAKQFTEVEDQRRLLAELEALTTNKDLGDWYRDNRTRIDGVVTKRYRDELFDAIRTKQSGFAN